MIKQIIMGVLLLALLAIPAVSAAEMYDLEDFTMRPEQAIILEEKDAVRFELLGGTHVMMIKEISRSNTSIKLNVYAFGGEVSQIPFFNLNNIVYADLDKDEVNDILLDIYKIEDNRVTLIIKAIEPETDEPAAGITVSDAPQGQGLVTKSVEKNHFRTFFVIGLAVVALLGVLTYRKHKGPRKRFVDIDEEKPKEEI